MKTKTKLALFSAGAALVLAANTFAAGPYPPDNWPTSIDPTKKVHFMSMDNVFTAPNENWTNCLGFCGLNTGADQGTVLAPCIKGFTGIKGGYAYVNVADTNFATWATNAQIDILMQVYGDTSVLNPTNSTMTRRLRFQEGTSASGYSTYNTPAGGLQYGVEAYNNRWNWVLFSITNNMWSNKVDSVFYRQVGTIKPGSSATSAINGGINYGTLRLFCDDNKGGANQFMMGYTIHAIAFGEAGAFGTTNDVNQFLPMDTSGETCPAAPPVNLVGIDFNAGTTNYLEPLNQGDSTFDYLTAYGPADDQRNCIMPTWYNGGAGYLINFAIISNYLGLPCNGNEIWKVCADFYDDPSFANMGYRFGPEAYAIDGLGCASPAHFSSSGLHPLTGSGKWIRRSWIVGNGTGVNLYGVNTAPNTGGPRLIAWGTQVAVSRVEMGILRSSGPLAGQDPLAGCAADPYQCDGIYADFGELDLPSGVSSNLDIGTPSNDQGFVVETSGPASDRRLSVRPGFGDGGVPGPYLQFQILNNAFGPNYQDNVKLAIVVTYYDDPALTNTPTSFGIDAWKYHSGASEPIFAADATKYMTLQGTDRWRDAYWEIDRIDFSGVNQLPQSAVRFKCDDRVHVCRVRYAVIRPCGPSAGVNLLDSYKVTSIGITNDAGGQVKLSWPYRMPQLTVQGSLDSGATWSLFKGTPIGAELEEAVLRLSPTNSSQLFRLYRPAIP